MFRGLLLFFSKYFIHWKVNIFEWKRADMSICIILTMAISDIDKDLYLYLCILNTCVW